MVAMEADDVKIFITAVATAADKFVEEGLGVRDLSAGDKGVIVHLLNRYAGGDRNRHYVLGWLFGNGGELSTKQLGAGQWQALQSWIKPLKSVGGGWEPAEQFPLECGRVLAKARGGIPLDFILDDYDSGEDIF